MLHYINFGGVAIAMVLTVTKIIKNCMLDLEDILHLLSLATTIPLHFYKGDMAFLSSMQVVRSLRLFFPLHINHSFKVLALKYMRIILKVIKVILPTVYITIGLSIVSMQAVSGSINSRCRNEVTVGSGLPSPTDLYLCGSR